MFYQIQSIRNKKLTSASWRSDQRSLLRIFAQSEALGISPECVSSISLCNLRTIIKKAKEAIAEKDVEGLLELFALAASLSTANLRLAIGSRVPKDLDVRPNEGVGLEPFLIAIDAEQLVQLEKSSKMYFSYKKTNPPSTWHSLGRYPKEVN